MSATALGVVERPPVGTQVAALRERARTSLWPVGLLYSALALAATLFNSPGSYIGDNRFEQYINPARRLAKAVGAWDPTRGLGAPREDLWPGTTIPGAIARGLGFAPWVGERCFHAFCLVTMALGVTALLRLFRPRIGVEHLVASLYAAFGPYSAAFLVPTNLYYMMALGPWLVVALVRGLTGERPWRWAAIFALLVAWAGNPDAPGLVYNAVILVITAAYLVHVERAARWRDVLRWASVMVALAVMCSAWALAKTYVARDMLNARLVDTELPSVSALTSSWSESMRGLGNWLSYFNSGGGMVKPQGAGYFLNAWVVIASFIVPLVALVALWKLRWRAKVLFGTMIVVSAALIVGGFAGPTRSPIGAAILWVMEHVTVASSFRNTYKVGGGLAIGVGVLAGVGVAAAARHLRDRRRSVRHLPTIGSLVVLITVSFPFWNGTVYHPFQRVAAVPRYWTDTFDYLDHLPDPGLTMVVPAITRASYRWGWVGDDIFDALLARPHAVSTGVPLSNPLGANALEVFTAAAQSVPYRPGVLGSIARRLGITEVVVRNDLTWESQNLPRPSAFDGLRRDPDFELVRSFGDPGIGVVSFRDRSNAAIRERSLPPVEVFRVRQPGALVSSLTTANGVLVAGDANAWPAVHANQVASSDRPLLTSGAVADAEIVDVVRHSAGVVITDTARRRLRTLVDYEPAYSATLAPGQDAGRVVREEFPQNPTAQSTTWFADAESVSPVGFIFSQIPAAFRPSNAFDRDPSTAFAVNWVLAKATPGVEVRLRAPLQVSHFAITSTLSADGVPGLKRVSVTLSDGTQKQAFVEADGTAQIDFPAVQTSSFTIRMEGIDRRQGQVGFTEVQVDNLDLREYIQTPTDLFGGRASLDGLESAMADAPTAYLFGRSTRTSYLNAGGTTAGRFDEDQVIRRRFGVARSGDYSMTGVLRRSNITSQDELDRWLEGDVSASASGSEPSGLEGLPADAIDGSLESAWIAPRAVGDTLTIHVPRQRVQRVVVAMQIDGPAVGASLVTATIGGTTLSVSPVADESCPPFLLADIEAQAASGASPSTTPCYRRAVFSLPEAVTTDSVTLSLERYDRRINRFGVQWFVNEVDVSGPDLAASDNKLDRSAPIGGECVDAGLHIGNATTADVATPISFHATVGDLLDGVAIPYAGCGAVQLATGSARLETAPHSVFESISLRSADWPTEQPSRITWAATRPGPDHADAQATLPVESTVVLGQSFDPLWMLRVDGAAPRAALPVDGLNGWVVPAGQHSLTFEYRPARVVRWSIIVTFVGIALSLCALVLRRRRLVALPSMDGWEFTSASFAAKAGAVAVATAMGALLVGPLALVVGLAVFMVIRWYDEPVEITGVATPLLFLIAACTSVALVYSGPSSVGLNYAKERGWAHQLTLVAMVFAVQTIALLAVAARRRSMGPLAPMVMPWRGVVRTSCAHWKCIAATAAAAAVGALGIVFHRDAGGIGGLVQQIRLGTKYSSTPFGGAPAVDLAPLAPVMRAVLPLGAATLRAIVVVALCVVATRLARQRESVVATWVVPVIIAVSPLSWGVSLGGQLAALFVLCAASVAHPPMGLRRAAAIGALLGVAVLARPDAVAVVMVAGLVLLVRRRLLHAGAVVVCAAVACASWAAFCWGAGTAPWLASTPLRMVLDESVSGLGRWLTWWCALMVPYLFGRVFPTRRSRHQLPASR